MKFFQYGDMEKIYERSQILVEECKELQSESVRLRIESQNLRRWNAKMVAKVSKKRFLETL